LLLASRLSVDSLASSHYAHMYMNRTLTIAVSTCFGRVLNFWVALIDKTRNCYPKQPWNSLALFPASSTSPLTTHQKLMLGNESAIDGASAEARGGRMPLVESDGSNEEVTIRLGIVTQNNLGTLWHCSPRPRLHHSPLTTRSS
jgi:hypothetical protein